MERLAAIQTDPSLPKAVKQLQLRSAFFLFDQETNLTSDIAAELLRSRDAARRMITGESLNLFNDGYRRQLGEITSQVGMAGIRLNFNAIDQSAINAIFNGENTPLGQLPGFRSAFTQVGFRQEIIQDRVRGRFFYNRAMGRLGDNADLVHRLQNSLVESMILGEGMPAITRRILNITGSCLNQARRIARTETMRAASQGRYLAASQVHQEFGLPMLKKWHTALDERTRPDHEAASGQTVKFDEPFIVGGAELMYPQDPNGPPEQTINCRCSATYRIDLAALRSAA